MCCVCTVMVTAGGQGSRPKAARSAPYMISRVDNYVADPYRTRHECEHAVWGHAMVGVDLFFRISQFCVKWVHGYTISIVHVHVLHFLLKPSRKLHVVTCPQTMHTLELVHVIPYSSKFSRSNNFVIFVRCKLIAKFLSTKIFTPMGVSIGAAMNHEKCCL